MAYKVKPRKKKWFWDRVTHYKVKAHTRVRRGKKYKVKAHKRKRPFFAYERPRRRRR